MGNTVLIIVGVILIAGTLGFLLAKLLEKNNASQIVSNAKKEAANIVKEAKSEGESIKKDYDDRLEYLDKRQSDIDKLHASKVQQLEVIWAGKRKVYRA